MREGYGLVWGTFRIIIGVLLLVMTFGATLPAFWMPVVVGVAAGHLIALGGLDWFQYILEGRRS